MRVAILGCGSIGSRHARNLVHLGYSDLALFDPEWDRLPGWYQLECSHQLCTTAIGAIWEWQPDAVLICSPPQFHVQQAMEAAEHGCHIFIEKPVSHNMAGVPELVELLDAEGLINMVACNWRYHEGPMRIKAALDSGVLHDSLFLEIGHQSYLPSWRRGTDWRKSYSASAEYGGVTLDVGWHLVDLALWLLGLAELTWADLRPAKTLGLQTDGWAELLRHQNGESRLHMDFERVSGDWWEICLSGGSGDQVSWDAEDSQHTGYEMNRMYLDEMVAFLTAVESGVPSANPVGEAVKVLQLLVQARGK